MGKQDGEEPNKKRVTITKLPQPPYTLSRFQWQLQKVDRGGSGLFMLKSMCSIGFALQTHSSNYAHATDERGEVGDDSELTFLLRTYQYPGVLGLMENEEDLSATLTEKLDT